MKLSVVATLYYSEKYIQEFYERIIKVILPVTSDYEIILVNDGSPDQSASKVLELQQNDERVVLVDLSRNFGHHKAIITGLKLAKGDYVFLIDIDLEEDPELFQSFWRVYHQENNVDAVYGIQAKRKGYWFEKISGKLFYTFFSFISDIDYPQNALTARLMSQRYVESVVKYEEKEIELRGIFVLAGFTQKAVTVTKKHKGSSTYTLKKKLQFAVNSVTSFSSRPLIYICVLGVAITIISFVSLVAIAIDKLFLNGDVEGWASILASIWLVGGVIMFSLGIIGIYLSKIFLEVKNRPLSIIRKIHRKI